MTNILRKLEKYDDLDSQQKLFHPELAQDIALIQNEMSAMNDSDLEIAKEFLNNLAQDIETTIGDLEKELADKPQVMNQIQRTMDACLAYSKAPTQKDKKE
jgi:hypothetical protein